MSKSITKKIASYLILISIILGGFSVVQNSEAAINKQFNYQGKLTDANGVAVADGAYDIVFKLYTVAGGGSAAWTESWTNAALWTETSSTTVDKDHADCGGAGYTKITYVTTANESSLSAGQTLWNTTKKESAVIKSVVTASDYLCIYNSYTDWIATDDLTNRIYVKDGLFSVMVGSVTAQTIEFTSSDYYLGLTVGADAEMKPRKKIGAVPFAWNANNVVGDGYVDLDNTSTSQDAMNINYNPASGTYDALDVTYGSGGGTGVALSVTQSGAGDIVNIFDGATEVFTILNGGNVGIGTVSPGTLLQLEKDGDAYLTLKNATDENTDGGAETRIIFEDHSDTALAQIQGSHDGAADDTKGDLIFSTHSGSALNEAMRIDSSGNVGIGTVAPTSLLDVNNTTTQTITAAANARILNIQGALTEAASGTHTRIMGVEITPPTITGGVATVTDTASLYISAAPTATVAGSNYALWVDAGNVRFDGDLTGTTGGAFGNIQIGITGDNEIDTSSGNLTIDSSGGTVTIDDNLTITTGTTISATSITALNLGAATIDLNGAGIVQYADASDFTIRDDGSNNIFKLTGGTDLIEFGNATDNNAFTFLGTGLTTLGGSLTVIGTAWTATPTISGAVTMTSGFDSNAASTVEGLTVDGNGNLTVSNGTLSVTAPSTTGNAGAIVANSLTSGNILSLTSNSTAAAANNTGLNIAISGANGTVGITRYGLQSAVTATNVTSGTNIAGYFSASGATTANYGLIVAAGDVGIGMTAPETGLHIGTDSPVSLTASSDDLFVTGELEVGENAYFGPMEFGADSGAVSWIDMPVTSSASINTVESYSARIDGTNILTVYSESDGAGGIQNSRVGILRTPSTNAFEVEGTASKTASGDWLANSDIRIKTDIEDLENPFDIISQLRPVKFHYTDEHKAAHSSIEDYYYYSFIAQEFQQVFPDSVKEGGDGLLQIDTFAVRPYLVAAVQELGKGVRVNSEGFVGIGKDDPDRKLDVFESGFDNPQLRLTQEDDTNFADFTVDAAGDLTVTLSGDELIIPDDNLKVCSGGACPLIVMDGTGNVQIEGDVYASGGYKNSFNFAQSDVEAGQTEEYISILGMEGNFEYTLPYPGSVTGISVSSNSQRADGTLAVDAAINGETTELQAVLNDENKKYNSTTQGVNIDSFSEGDRLSVKITTSADWKPDVADIVVTVVIEY